MGSYSGLGAIEVRLVIDIRLLIVGTFEYMQTAAFDCGDGLDLKIRQLSYKWNDIEDGIDRENQLRRESVDEVVSSIQERSVRGLETGEMRFRLLGEQLARVKEALQSESINLERFQDERVRQIKEIEDYAGSLLRQERAIIGESQESYRKLCNERFAELREEKVNPGEVELAIRQAWEKVAVVESLLRQQRKRREELTTSVSEKIEFQLNGLESLMGRERRDREEIGGRIVKMVEEVGRKLQSQIEQERKARAETGRRFVQLIEGTCAKIRLF